VETRDIIVVGSSAGGVDALTRLAAGLPADLPAAVFVAQHLSPDSRSVLPQLLGRAGPLPAETPTDGQTFRRGRIYIAPPDHHLLLRADRMLVRRGPFENRTRPAVNALFRSAALAFGGRVIGVVLTGLLDDGTNGLIAIKAGGGLSVVQDPDDAAWPSMPLNAVKRDHVDRVVPLADLPALLAALTAEEAGASTPLPPEYAAEDRIAALEFANMEPEPRTLGRASTLSCPDCGGVLNEIAGADDPRFRCQVGHAFTPLGLAAAQAAELERALGVAIRTHRDRIRLFDQMRDAARTRGLSYALNRWEKARTESEQMMAVLEQAAAVLREPPLDGVG
jgi:two-component system chemotaxis response regulator CheB